MPRQATTRANITQDTLFDGVPVWMQPSLLRFITSWTASEAQVFINGNTRHSADVNRINEIERYLQIRLDTGNRHDTYAELIAYANSSEEKMLDIVEAIVATNNNTELVVRDLNVILSSAGSKWVAIKHNSGSATLEERVGLSAEDAFESAIDESNATTQGFLKVAWKDGFGRNPNPSSAYSNAIKAIEAAAWPLVTPRDNRATLGTILGELRSHISMWETSIAGTTREQGPSLVKDIMQLIWDGQTDRHGTANPSAPTQEAAEQAILSAVIICNLINRGIFRRA